MVTPPMEAFALLTKLLSSAEPRESSEFKDSSFKSERWGECPHKPIAERLDGVAPPRMKLETENLNPSTLHFPLDFRAVLNPRHAIP